MGQYWIRLRYGISVRSLLKYHTFDFGRVSRFAYLFGYPVAVGLCPVLSVKQGKGMPRVW